MSFKTADVKFLRWESIVDKYLIDCLNEFNTRRVSKSFTGELCFSKYLQMSMYLMYYSIAILTIVVLHRCILH